MDDLLRSKVLVVDDAEINVGILVETLKDDYEVTVAMDGESALKRIESSPPDIILLDIVMPTMDGFEVCKRLKENRKTRNIPIIFITILTDEKEEGKGLKLGAVDYITKPFSPELVKARVRNHLELKRYQDHLEELVQESDRQVRLLLDSTAEGIYGLDIDGNCTFANSASANLLGYKSTDELVGKTMHNLIHHTRPDGSPYPLEECHIYEALRREEGIHVDDEIMWRADGTSFSAEYWSFPIRLDDQVVGSVVTFFNITERKLASEKLLKSEEKYRNILENIEEGYYELDLFGNFTFFNDSVCKIMGYSRDELIGMNNRQYMEEESAKKAYNIYTKILSTGESIKGFEHEIIRKDGSRIYVENSVSLIKDLEGQSIGFRGVARDITERKRAEEALHEEQERFRLLVEKSPLGVALIDKENVYKYINPKFIETFGYTLEDVPTRRQWFIKAYPDEKYREHVISTLRDDRKKYDIGELGSATFEVNCKDGIKKTILFRTVTMESGDSLLIYENVTESRHLEKQLRQAQKLEAIGTLAGGIAHDFNNILASLLGYTELAIIDVDDKKVVLEDLQEIRKAANRAKDLVSQILAFSRQSKQELRPIKVKLIIKEALKLLRSSLPTTIEIRDNILSDALVMADATQIHQVLMNLCTNASHAMQEEGGILEVGLFDVSLDSDFAARYPDIKPGTFLKLTVRDTGSGISPDILNKIFDPFFTTKGKGEGTGLGLSVVHGIIKNINGTIIVYSEPEKGTEFIVYLPVIESRDKEEQEFETPLPTGTERILFVDDEQPLREIGKKIIESLGYHVEVRSNGIEALELFKANPERFDLIITDMTMPNMTGDRLAEQLMAVRSNIPIILCTGFSARMDEKKAKVMGIRSFVLKPIIKSDIAKIIRTVLDEARAD